jgi:hypothetical protein
MDTEVYNEFLEDALVPSCQLYFPNDELLKKVLNLTSRNLIEKKYFSRVSGYWKDELKVETEFYKIELFGEEFLAFRFPKLFKESFIGKYEIRDGDDYSSFRVMDIGFFDIGDSFHKERFYIQINSPTVGNDFGNNEYFRDEVWKKFEEIESFRVGSREILEQNEVRKTQKENAELKSRLENFQKNLEKQKYSNDILELEKLEKELKEVSSTILKKKLVSEKTETQNISKVKNSLVWSGENIRDFGVSEKLSFLEFEKAVLGKIEKDEKAQKDNLAKELKSKLPPKNANFSKSLEPKDEFETELEFQQRKRAFELEKKRFELDYKKRRDNQISENLMEVEKISLDRSSKSEMLNSYLGKQSIEMKYLAEKSEFSVKVKNRLFSSDFQIEVSRNIAREFKSEIESFEFRFSENLVLETIQTEFQGKEFKKNILEEIEREREMVEQRLIFLRCLLTILKG